MSTPRSPIPFASLLLLVLTACAVHAEPRPNLLFLLADDLGYGDLGVQGNRGIRTPNLDQLAAEGVRLERFYVNSPMCSSSRVSFATGQYPDRWRIMSYLAYRRENRDRGMVDYLDPRAPSLARILRTAGYATGHFGKWHLGGQRDVGDAPLIIDYGFDQSLTQFEGLGDRLLPVFSRPMLPRWGEERRHPLGVESAALGRGRTEFVPRASATRRWVDAAIAFIQKAKTDGKPFYVNLWPDDPHTPVEPSEAARGDGSPAARYRGVVEELDRDLGRLIAFIRADEALRANTLIVFTSDNGPEPGYGSTGGLRGAKTNLYEGGLRVPFIFWGPSLITPGSVGTVDRDSVVLAMDFAPTVLALSGVKPREKFAFDGEDMSQVWRGQKKPQRARPVFWSRPPDHPGPHHENPDAAALQGKWKLLRYDHTATSELYDVARDPAETTNLAPDHPDVVAHLRTELDAWRAAMPH